MGNYILDLMKLTLCGDTLRVSDITQLRASNSEEFRSEVLSSVVAPLSCIDIDLSKVNAVDSAGLGTLIMLGKMATRHSQREVTVRLINPTPSVQQVLELTRVYRVLEVVNVTAFPECS